MEAALRRVDRGQYVKRNAYEDSPQSIGTPQQGGLFNSSMDNKLTELGAGYAVTISAPHMVRVAGFRSQPRILAPLVYKLMGVDANANVFTT